jgi:amino acid transporter
MVVMVVVLRDLSVGGLLLALVAVEVLVVALVAVMLMSPRVCLLLSRVWDAPIPRVVIVSRFRVSA